MKLISTVVLLIALATAATAVITAWLIPHSHDDVGWLKTIDDYYESEVRHIYNTVIDELQKREDRKFIIVEMAFFTMWWAEANQTQKDLVHQYVEKKKVEFVLGGWSMPDDAGPAYGANVNQMAEGHRFIYNTFGVLPKYGWHIDPFGLSSYYPTLFSAMGFNGHVINRIHYSLKDQFKRDKHMEFIWRGSHSLGAKSEMMTHVLSNHYSFPSGFDFESNEPITDNNIASKAQTLVNDFKNRANWYRSEHLLIPGGDDFRYVNAKVQYENWDKLIDYINARSEQYGVQLRYSTLADYFENLAEQDIEWPVYEKDFFPYADNGDSYWTGYFTSHSQLKGYIRSRASLLRTSEFLGLSSAVTSTPSGVVSDPNLINSLRWATGEAQHHDAVTGTAKIHVVDMYYDHLDDGSVEAVQLATESLSSLTEKSASRVNFDDQPNAINNLQAGQIAPIIVTNALGWNVHTIHSIIIERSDIAIVNGNGERIRQQITPHRFSSDGVTRYQLFFEVDLPAAGFNTYYAQVSSDVIVSKPIALKNDETPIIENGVFSINVTRSSNYLIWEVTNKKTSKSVHITEEIMEYPSYTGSGQKSGAYIFRPAGAATRVSGSGGEYSFVDGDLVQIVYHQASPAHFEALKLFRLDGEMIEDQIEMQFSIGTLQKDREAIVRWTTTMDNTRLFSDNNGVEMHERDPASSLIQANYYPMVAQSFLRSNDGDSEFSLTSERTIGVSSLTDGQVEVMLHRRCSMDDSRGVGEALDDQTIIFPTLKVAFSSISDVESFRPHAAHRFQHRPTSFYGPATSSVSYWQSNYRTDFTVLNGELPRNIHLLGFKVVTSTEWEKATLRLQHIYETDASPEYENPVTIELETLFNANYTVSEELDLSGIAPFEPRYIHFSPEAKKIPTRISRARALTLNAMELKTFELTFN